ncbi:OmpA family protein [Aestuariicella hydrocarbonica]|uniref:OmpA family protein n=2 Tax=Pseudomaricurvus hydrocarbonicus TaxID=1470433 RepID=A0A9E5K0D4_9GAMM|nr:OmpA family protein [Aestuariicella hydrocarbonica]
MFSAPLVCLGVLLFPPMLSAESFSGDASGRLFHVQGSNTVGASLMKNLLVGYFQAQGVADIDVTPSLVANEYRVGGTINGRFVYVDVAAHGSSTGFQALLAGDADLSMSSRPIKAAEVARMQSYGDMRAFEAEHVIAIDGLAVIVSRANPLTQLSLDQIAAIFSGQVTNWQQVGGEDLPINVFARDDRSGTWDTFKSLVLRKRYTLSAQASRYESNDELSDLVAADPGGIGFVGLASVRHARALRVSDEGTAPLLPHKVSVATEDYVLSRRLFLYTPPTLKTAAIRDFVHFVQTDAGQKQVERTGFVSQSLTAIAAQKVRQGPLDYLQATEGASRLSVNFRFSEGSASLDNKALHDIRRVVDYMQRQENQHKQLTLVGFGDANDSDSRALILSKLRAVAVKTKLHKEGIKSQPVEGFGAYLPVASNSGKGKLKNQRVEIWVK